MKKELSNIFGNVFLKIKVDPDKKWVYNDWIGYLTMDNVKKGALAYIEVVEELGYHCVLNDNSKVLGSWDHSMDWTKNEWEPLAAQAGIKHFAMIVSQDSMTESSVKAFEALISLFEVKVFYSKDAAAHWLRLRSVPAN